ncbi:hypothetical protein CBR_g34449 [Chara braunii]|uniref:Uncharacterized protein n=1 Tax=Chara braunii TaxID=69332 RepID=A0A388LIM5_CHABU|nr:hypothetical protein CBR_g34449 [Chara braunii]|eukprot:GBG82168.1 hypothetical protein CBR_g34449 [Chara braunii]
MSIWREGVHIGEFLDPVEEASHGYLDLKLDHCVYWKKHWAGRRPCALTLGMERVEARSHSSKQPLYMEQWHQLTSAARKKVDLIKADDSQAVCAAIDHSDWQLQSKAEHQPEDWEQEQHQQLQGSEKYGQKNLKKTNHQQEGCQKQDWQQQPNQQPDQEHEQQKQQQLHDQEHEDHRRQQQQEEEEEEEDRHQDQAQVQRQQEDRQQQDQQQDQEHDREQQWHQLKNQEQFQAQPKGQQQQQQDKQKPYQQQQQQQQDRRQHKYHQQQEDRQPDQHQLQDRHQQQDCYKQQDQNKRQGQQQLLDDYQQQLLDDYQQQGQNLEDQQQWQQEEEDHGEENYKLQEQLPDDQKKQQEVQEHVCPDVLTKAKRKRVKTRKTYMPNVRELEAIERHNECRAFLVSAFEEFKARGCRGTVTGEQGCMSTVRRSSFGDTRDEAVADHGATSDTHGPDNNCEEFGAREVCLNSSMRTERLEETCARALDSEEVDFVALQREASEAASHGYGNCREVCTPSVNSWIRLQCPEDNFWANSELSVSSSLSLDEARHTSYDTPNATSNSTSNATSNASEDQRSIWLPLVNNVISNPYAEEMVGSIMGRSFIIPPFSTFLCSDLSELHRMVPVSRAGGYNLIVLDPPWENKSVHRKDVYPTLPNRYLLSLPVASLAHEDGALVALWVTCREKLRRFAENELFPKWGVDLVATWYWLKVSDKGEMVSPLDLAHHRPYEPLLLGFLPPTRQSARKRRKCWQEIAPAAAAKDGLDSEHARLLGSSSETTTFRQQLVKGDEGDSMWSMMTYRKSEDLQNARIQVCDCDSPPSMNRKKDDGNDACMSRNCCGPPHVQSDEGGARTNSHRNGFCERSSDISVTQEHTFWDVRGELSGLERTPTITGKRRGFQGEEQPCRVPDHFVIISRPGAHSRKPVLRRLLEGFVPGQGVVKPLELFARNLLPGWTSWGNEPLKFQDQKYFLSKGRLFTTLMSHKMVQ